MRPTNLTRRDPDATLPFSQERFREHCLSRLRKSRGSVHLSRREFLQYCQLAPLALLPASLPFRPFLRFGPDKSTSPLELQLHPEYRVQRDIDAILRKVPAGFDEFITEKYQDEIEVIFREWSVQLLQSPQANEALAEVMSSNFLGTSLRPAQERMARETPFLKAWKVEYPAEAHLPSQPFLTELRSALSTFSNLLNAEFQIISIHAQGDPAGPVSLTTIMRFELAGTGSGFYREQRVGHWELRWQRPTAGKVQLESWKTLNEERSRSFAPLFQDITSHAFGGNPSYTAQLLPGTDHWRTVLDGATGIDIYGHNGIAIADVDGDGLDDIYICQPAGLPNRLFRNRGDGTFQDITEAAGVGVLEYSACAFLVDVDNDGRQDLIVVRSNGPLLFLNQGGTKFRLKPDAFQFANPPQGTCTGAAMADYDRDGWVDLYICLYSYYQGADQYRYPMPYDDAENGPPNFLLRNNRDGTFRDVTKETKLDQNNTRFSFCCAWGDYNGDNWPDLYVVNDFGRKNLYRNNGNGTFTDVAPQAGVEDIGAGMSGAWIDFQNRGRDDLYVANMWTAAGIRVSEQDIFQRDADATVRAQYHQHAMGNCLFENQNDHFSDSSMRSGAMMGRWAWCSDAWDFDHDGFPDLYIANGFITCPSRDDLNSFFWRQVVNNSPNEARPSHEYEQAWNAVNDLIRSDRTWSGFERNMLYMNNHDGTFSDVSAVADLDFIQDGRSFALGDFDGDGRLEVVLKNRNSPQLRYLKNVIANLPPAISFRLTGKKSNRDAIGAKITVETRSGRQTRSIGCGSGFLAQHSRELFFGLGEQTAPVQATIEWPSGLMQKLQDLPVNHRIWVEEGQPPTRIEAFARPPALPANAASPEPLPLPDQVETWLIVLVLAPNFSLTDESGQTHDLLSRRGKPVLLHFWSESLANAQEDLRVFERSHEAWARAGLQLLTVRVDDVESANSTVGKPVKDQYSFTVLKASPDVIATYNLLYRQLFDRHRDISVPVSFLIDPAGNIVKIYQGVVSKEKYEADFRSIPRNDSERLAKALPFPGFRETYQFERNYLSLGFVFFERGYFEQAEQFFGQAAKDDPTSAEALYGLGSAYLQQQKTNEAADCFERALKLHPGYPGTLPNCWNNLGILAARQGNYDQAIQYFQAALQIDPKHSIALQNLGSAYRHLKNWPEAKSTLERALALNPDDPEANYSLGMVYAQQNDAEHANEYLQKAIAARPAYPEALNNLGILYLRTRRPDQAIQSFEQSIRVAPSYDQSYLNLARVYAIQGDREKARAILRDLLKVHPENAQAKEGLKQLEN